MKITLHTRGMDVEQRRVYTDIFLFHIFDILVTK